MINQKPLLRLVGSQLLNGDGESVMLRGLGLGGWLNMENFITGYPGCEEDQRRVIRSVLGQDKYEFFFDRFLTYFFEEDDAQYVQSLGLNLIRIPVNYRHFEDDMNPFEIKESGFLQLDRVIDACARHGIYTIIDLHALPGYQNGAWHSDNPTHRAFLWDHKHFQDRTVNLWQAFATHYKDNPWVAGYNPINEPYDPGEKVIGPFYRRLYDAIRAIDPNHLIFLEGNRYSQDFHMLGDPLPGVVYTNHDYAPPGYIWGGPYPGLTQGKYFDKEVLHEKFLKNSEYMLKHKTHIWVGEFGPVYTGDAEQDAMRYQILRDQLDIYQHYQTSWAIWLYKDIGLQGLTYAAPDSPWMERIQPILKRKERFGADGWGHREDPVANIMDPINETLNSEFPHYQPGPFGALWYGRRMVRHILFSEALLPEFAESFRGMSEVQIDTMMKSFQFKNCVQRKPLGETLSKYAK